MLKNYPRIWSPWAAPYGRKKQSRESSFLQILRRFTPSKTAGRILSPWNILLYLLRRFLHTLVVFRWLRFLVFLPNLPLLVETGEDRTNIGRFSRLDRSLRRMIGPTEKCRWSCKKELRELEKHTGVLEPPQLVQQGTPRCQICPALLDDVKRPHKSNRLFLRFHSSFP